MIAPGFNYVADAQAITEGCLQLVRDIHGDVDVDPRFRAIALQAMSEVAKTLKVLEDEMYQIVAANSSAEGQTLLAELKAA